MQWSTSFGAIPKVPSAAFKQKALSAPPVWALAVVSSDGQSDTLVHQRRWAEEAAAAHGWRLTRVIEGVASGKAGPRQMVRDLIAELRSIDAAARPAQILMIRADRLGRGSVIESQVVLRDVLALGVGIFTRDQGSVKLDSAMDELISAATLAVARHENDVRRDKMRSVYRQKRARGELVGNRAPYGLVRTNGKDVVDKERAAVVKEAFKLRLRGLGYGAIGKRLAAIAPPHAFKNKTTKHPDGKRVIHWTATRVSILLKNRAYIGPIVTEATFARAQQVAGVLANTPKAGKRQYRWPLSGALKCYCGRGLIGMPCGAHPWRYRYYACKAGWNHENRLRLIRSDNVEEQFVELLRRLRASPKLVADYRKRAAAPVSLTLLERSLKELKSQVAAIDKKREAAWDLHAAGKVKSDDLQGRLDKLASQRDELRGRVASVEEQIAVAKDGAKRDADADALLKRAAALFVDAEEARQRDIARLVALSVGGLFIDEKAVLRIGRPA